MKRDKNMGRKRKRKGNVSRYTHKRGKTETHCIAKETRCAAGIIVNPAKVVEKPEMNRKEEEGRKKRKRKEKEKEKKKEKERKRRKRKRRMKTPRAKNDDPKSKVHRVDKTTARQCQNCSQSRQSSRPCRPRRSRCPGPTRSRRRRRRQSRWRQNCSAR